MPHTEKDLEQRRYDDSDTLRVPFWIPLAGVGAGAFWALAGRVVGVAIVRRRRD